MMMDGLNSPQRNVPVLGADIIAQTFAGSVVRVIVRSCISQQFTYRKKSSR